MIRYDNELDEIEHYLLKCPTQFLSSLSFRLQVILMERDVGYQHWLSQRQSTEGVKLSIVKTED